jgi:uncharacterized membrane protein
MTLLITLVTPQTIYQSADFRLTDLNTGRLITDESSKLISLQYKGWQGFVAYTGIGGWKGRHTRDFIIEWLDGFQATSPREVADRISSKGTAWLSEIEKALGKRPPHTFVVTAFDNREPLVAVTSNFENAYETYSKYPATELTTTVRQFGNGAGVVVCGCKQAVERQSRNLLKRVASEAQDDPARLRILLERINAESAKSPRATNLISPNCSVMSFRADGQGAGIVDGKIDIRSIMLGRATPGLEEITRMMRASTGNPDFSLGRIKGISLASSGTRLPFAPCEPKVFTPPGAQGYTVRELTIEGLASCSASDVNDSGVVLGQGTRPERLDLNVPWTRTGESVLYWQPDKTEQAVHLSAINNSSQIAMHTRATDGTLHASRWTDNSQFTLEHYLASSDSCAMSINNNGTVVGWVSIDAAKKGQESHRPAAWKTDKLIQFPNFQGDWGYVADVNDNELALVLIYVRSQPHAVLWDLNNGNCRVIPGRAGTYPLAISNARIVLGNLNLSNGSTLALTSFEDEGWKPLKTPPGHYATALNTAGDVAGYSRQNGYDRPWLRRASGEVFPLPYFEFHNCTPAAINDPGVIIGSAGTDHGAHALIWLPPKESYSPAPMSAEH